MGILGLESRDESEVMEPLQQPDGSLYIVIRGSGSEMLNGKSVRSNYAIILHCRTRLAISVALLPRVSRRKSVLLQDATGKHLHTEIRFTPLSTFNGLGAASELSYCKSTRLRCRQ
jgi:hypothetical protein